jgi:hypothetical protein
MVIYISLGMDCCIAYQLRELNLKFVYVGTLPFDWCLSKNILDIINIFESGWTDYLNKDNWIIEDNHNNNFENINNSSSIKSNFRVKHKKYKLIYPHDLLENNIDYFIEKYTRRVKRLYSLINEEIIFIRLGTNKDIKYINKLDELLKSIFVNSKLKFINSSSYTNTTDWKRNNIDWKNILFNQI